MSVVAVRFDRRKIHSCGRTGFTLLEFTISSAIVGILMVGMMSSIHLVSRAARLSEGPHSVTAESARVAEQVLADLRLAQQFRHRTGEAVTITVPDRDGDDTAETITYQWAGDPLFQLQRTVQHSQDDAPAEPAVLASGVVGFDLQYLIKTWGPPAPEPEVESDETLLIAHDLSPSEIGRRVLLVMADAANPQPGEAAAQMMMQNWGCAVEAMSAATLMTQWDTALGRSDVVYLTATVSAADLALRLRDVAVGVISEQPLLADELGIGEALNPVDNSAVLNETVGTHAITRGFLPGAQVKLYPSEQPMAGLQNSPLSLAAGIETLAACGGCPALAVLPPGAPLYRSTDLVTQNPGLTTAAAGRRAHVPWGLSGAGALADEGRQLMRRAIAWAADDPASETVSEFGVTASAWPAQYLLPPLPANVTGWRITRVFVRLRAHPANPWGRLQFSLCYAGLNLQPSPFLIQATYPIYANEWEASRYQWYEVPFQETGDLQPQTGVCLVVRGVGSGTGGYVAYDQNRNWMTANTHLTSTASGGTSWSSPDASRDMRFYVYGKYLTQGDLVW